MSTVLARNWWTVALRGLVRVLFGIMVIVWPTISLTALMLLFAIYALTDGVFAMLVAVRCRGEYSQWRVLLLEGGIGIVLGIFTFIWPRITALVLLYLIAVGAIVTGVLEIIAAIALRKEMKNEWLWMLGGIVSVVAGLVMAIWPSAGALAVLHVIAASAIVFGLLLIALALRLRGWQKTVQVMGE